MPIVHRNLSRRELTEWAMKLEFDADVTDKGALVAYSYHKKGRSPTDKRVVMSQGIKDDVDWGNVNIGVSEESFERLKVRAKRFLDRQERLFVVDCFAGHDKTHRLKVRVITTRPYHAMFMTNMLIEPTKEELENFGEPDYTIYNAGECCADRTIPGVKSETCVSINFRTREQVILGTQYAGEMKKGILTVMMYVETKRGNLCMHASANESRENGDVTVFFGLSGTGKTTLSADPARSLIGDDEHVWTPNGIFNVEGGCYAKAIGLSESTEPDIFRAIRAGALAENVVLNPKTKAIDFDDITLTENTRVSYPLSHIPGAKLPQAVGGHPKNIVFLTNDAYGVMPPVAELTPAQAKFWFITGYTAKVAGTEDGVKDPKPTFSPCFGGPFLVMHPTEYGDLLAQKMLEHNARVWLVNTGWSGGKYGVGKRMKLSITRALITAINNGTLAKQDFETMPGWGLRIPKSCPGCPSNVLNPINTWKNKDEYVFQVDDLAAKFRANFEKYIHKATADVRAAMPQAYRTGASKL